MNIANPFVAENRCANITLFLANIKHNPEATTNIDEAIKHFIAPNLSNKVPPTILPANENIANIEPVIPTVAAVNFKVPWK